MGKLKRLAGDTVLYGLGSILPKFLNFLLIWLHTKIFLPAEYGVISYLYSYVSFINVIFTFGMETAYFRFATKPGADEKKIFNLAQTVVIGISLILSIVIIGFANPIANALDIKGKSNFIIWIVTILFIDSAVAIPFARLRLQKRPLQYALGRIINILILVGLNWYFLTFMYDASIGVAYVFIANLAANVFYLLFFSKTLISSSIPLSFTILPTHNIFNPPAISTVRAMLFFTVPSNDCRENFFKSTPLVEPLLIIPSFFSFARLFATIKDFMDLLLGHTFVAAK
jgi:O-antigen/teichoic acid export membrane protein